MYSLHLSPEQLEIRDMVRDFSMREIKPVAVNAERLNACDRRLSTDLLKQASQLGLRTLMLSEAAGGVGADHLTCCIVTEELAAGDADLAAVLAETSLLAHLVFDCAMTDAQRGKFLPKFLADDLFHLAFAGHEADTDTRLGVNYFRPERTATVLTTTADKAGNGDWIVNGVKNCVANASVAGLFAVLVKIPARHEPGVLLVAADAAGVSVGPHEKPWQHGVYGTVSFKDCRVPADYLLNDNAAALLSRGDGGGRGIPLFQVVNLGIGRAAYDAAVDYARLRVQGGRPIIEHQAIGVKIAEIAIKLEVARAAIWQAAWASDHPAAYADRSLPNLPLQTIAQVFSSEVLLKAVKDAAELFGAMGVMRDMPLQKYVHDALVCLHHGDSNTDAKLRITEGLVDYQRPSNDALAAASA